MTTYAINQVVKLKANPAAEARMIMLIADDQDKPLVCRPVSEVYIESPATAPETYSPDEVRPALPYEYVLKTPRMIVVERTYRALDDFRKQIPSDRLFESFQRVVELYKQDEHPGPEGQQILAEAVTRTNHARKAWSNIMIELLLDLRVPLVVLERVLLNK